MSGNFGRCSDGDVMIDFVGALDQDKEGVEFYSRCKAYRIELCIRGICWIAYCAQLLC